jgi:hypothetical protein
MTKEGLKINNLVKDYEGKDGKIIRMINKTKEVDMIKIIITMMIIIIIIIGMIFITKIGTTKIIIMKIKDFGKVLN